MLIFRLLLIAVPFIAWFIWREVARRTGRDIGSTPWGWLFAAGCVLAALSLMATAFFQADNRRETYVPADTTADGGVVSGRFEE